ncbi:MAG: hypothetical protein ABR591_07030 [Candidatus Velthaea sp.]
MRDSSKPAAVRDYELSQAPFDVPSAKVARWYPTLGDVLDEHDRENRFAIVIDGDDPPTAYARDIRVAGDGDPLRARLDYIDDDGGEDTVDLINVRAIGLIAD